MFIGYQSLNFYIIVNVILFIAEYPNCIYGPHKHNTDANYILKIIQTTFYQQQPHKYFNLIIFNEILIIQKLSNFSDVQLWNSLRVIQMYQNM